MAQSGMHVNEEMNYCNMQYQHRYFITNDDPSKERKECVAFLTRQEFIPGERPTSFSKKKKNSQDLLGNRT